MSPLEKARPGIRLGFLSQKMDANEPEKKKMLSTAAKATKRSRKDADLSEIQWKAQSALRFTQK